MPRENTNTELLDELKIDKDCFVDKQWIEDYIKLITSVCKKFGVTVQSIKMCNSQKKGLHFYIKINQGRWNGFKN